MAKNHYRVTRQVNVDFYPPVLDSSPQFIIDSEAYVQTDDTLVRTMLWFWLAVSVNNPTHTHQPSMLQVGVSVGATFYPGPPPAVPVSPWDPDKGVVLRSNLTPSFSTLSFNPSTGAIAGYMVRWSIPPSGISSAAQRKGNGGAFFPLVQFSLDVFDPSGELYSADTNRAMRGWLYAVTTWATDGVVP